MDTHQLNKPRSPWATIGKVAIVVVVLAVLVGAGVLIGKYWSNKSSDSASNNTVANEVSNVTNSTNNTAVENTTTDNTTNTEANNTTETKTYIPPANSTNLSVAGNSLYKGYKIYFPNTWSWEKQHVGGGITLNLSHNSFSMAIAQTGGGNGPCVFPGESSDEPLGAQFEAPIAEVDGVESQFRIAMQEGDGSAGAKHYKVCQKLPGNTWTIGTTYGYITVVEPPEGAVSGWAKDHEGIQAALASLQREE